MREIDTSGAGTVGAGSTAYRLTQFAHGGGCACKIPPGELEEILSGIATMTSPDLVVGVEHGDDAAVFRVREGLAVVSTADFFTPVVDDAYDWGRIAAANAFSDVYAMGGRPVLAINLVGWPRDLLPMELLREVLRGGLDVGLAAGAPIAGGHSIDDPEPKYGLAVTGVVDPDRLLRNDAARAGLPISLTKPLGVGMLNNRAGGWSGGLVEGRTHQRFVAWIASGTAIVAYLADFDTRCSAALALNAALWSLIL